MAGRTRRSSITALGAEGNTLSLLVTLSVTPARLRQVLALGGPLAFEDGALADEKRIALRVVR